MPIKVECKCGKPYVVPDKFNGKMATCNACGNKFLVGKKVAAKGNSSKKKGKKRPAGSKISGSSQEQTKRRLGKVKSKSSGSSMIMILTVLVIFAGIGVAYYMIGGNESQTSQENELIANSEGKRESSSDKTVSNNNESENEYIQVERQPAKILSLNEFPVGIWRDGDKVFVLGQDGSFLSNVNDMPVGVWSYEAETLTVECGLVMKSYKGFDGKAFWTGPEGGSLKVIEKAAPRANDFILLGTWKGSDAEMSLLDSGSFISSIPKFEKGFYRVLGGYVQLVSSSQLILVYNGNGSFVNPLNKSSFKK
jgi:hypothetical protein